MPANAVGLVNAGYSIYSIVGKIPNQQLLLVGGGTFGGPITPGQTRFASDMPAASAVSGKTYRVRFQYQFNIAPPRPANPMMPPGPPVPGPVIKTESDDLLVP